MQGRRILLGITGGIAAYKSAELCRTLVKRGADVRVIMSEAATEFITPLTMETLSSKPVPVKMFRRTAGALEHIDIPDQAELMVVAPATADYLARCASGRASDLISSVTLAFTGPVLAAPAMNTNMWQNPATRRNLKTLVDEHGWSVVQPGSGDLACGWTGPGRMADPSQIADAVQGLLSGDLADRKIVISAGPTVEDMDPVRFFSNRSTGKMGYALATAASRRGAEVVLVSGPTALSPPGGVKFVPVRSALEMETSINEEATDSDAVIMSAAVADYRPRSTSDQKMKKAPNTDEVLTVEMVRNPDILAGLGKRFEGKDAPTLIGFALETQNLVEAAQAKLESKGAAMIVANLASDGFAGDDNRATLVQKGVEPVDTGRVSKDRLADLIYDQLVRRWSS